MGREAFTGDASRAPDVLRGHVVVESRKPAQMQGLAQQPPLDLATSLLQALQWLPPHRWAAPPEWLIPELYAATRGFAFLVMLMLLVQSPAVRDPSHVLSALGCVIVGSPCSIGTHILGGKSVPWREQPCAGNFGPFPHPCE